MGVVDHSNLYLHHCGRRYWFLTPTYAHTYIHTYTYLHSQSHLIQTINFQLYNDHSHYFQFQLYFPELSSPNFNETFSVLPLCPITHIIAIVGKFHWIWIRTRIYHLEKKSSFCHKNPPPKKSEGNQKSLKIKKEKQVNFFVLVFGALCVCVYLFVSVSVGQTPKYFEGKEVFVCQRDQSKWCW